MEFAKLRSLYEDFKAILMPLSRRSVTNEWSALIHTRFGSLFSYQTRRVIRFCSRGCQSWRHLSLFCRRWRYICDLSETGLPKVLAYF